MGFPGQRLLTYSPIRVNEWPQGASQSSRVTGLSCSTSQQFPELDSVHYLRTRASGDSHLMTNDDLHFLSITCHSRRPLDWCLVPLVWLAIQLVLANDVHLKGPLWSEHCHTWNTIGFSLDQPQTILYFVIWCSHSFRIRSDIYIHPQPWFF